MLRTGGAVGFGPVGFGAVGGDPCSGTGDATRPGETHGPTVPPWTPMGDDMPGWSSRAVARSKAFAVSSPRSQNTAVIDFDFRRLRIL